MAENLNIIIQATDKASGTLDKVGKATTKLEGFASAMAKGFVVAGAAAGSALVGIGAAAFNVANDIDVASDHMQAALGLSADRAENFEGAMKGVFANNFGENFDDIAQSMISVNQQFERVGGVEGDLQKVTEAALAMRDVFEVDVNESTGAAVTLMDEFGITSQQAFDMIAAGMQSGMNSSGDFLDTIGEYSNLFADSGASAEEFFSVLSSGLAGGVLGTDKVADLFKEFNIRILDGSDATAEALAAVFGSSGSITINTDAIEKSEETLSKYRQQLELASLRQSEFSDTTKESTKLSTQLKIQDLTRKIQEEEAALSRLNATNGQFTEGVAGLIDYSGGMSQFLADLSSGTLSGADAFDIIQTAIAGIDDKAQQMALGVALMGTQFEDMGAQAVAAIDSTTFSMDDSAGAVDSLNVKYDNFGSMFEGLKRRFLLAIAPMGESLLTFANDHMPQAEEAMRSLEKFMGETLPETIAELKETWDEDWGEMRTTLTEFTDDMPGQVETMWNTINGVFDKEEEKTENKWSKWTNRLLESLTGFVNLGIAQVTELFKTISGIQMMWQGIVDQDWSTFWTGLEKTLNAMTDAFLNTIEYVFGAELRNTIVSGLTSAWDAIQNWWNGVTAWWRDLNNNLFGFPNLEGNVSQGFNFATIGNGLVGGLPSMSTETQPAPIGDNRSTTYNVTINGATNPQDTAYAVQDAILRTQRRRGY